MYTKLQMEICDKNGQADTYIGYVRNLLDDIGEFFDFRPENKNDKDMILYYFNSIRQKVEMTSHYACEAEELIQEAAGLIKNSIESKGGVCA